ncbi:low molecular weight protein-tyrosine-phosphatase [Collinsella sp. D33t1_170424_A12]|uniref:low molecular weight protein-tyrosine-phosphatase n=1 Tax=Collinsella sp. D33t1_170424_A12 TaxID=2787135 RepID=UPI001897AFB2|nr:low molecular weight protein-tyrosine-phosphatase [Collinsella sp. D33t1_170424_A12]
MHRILFICHGNICRSSMAQFVFEELVRRAGREDEFAIDSAATSREEIGNPPHRGTVAKLREVGIPVGPHRARQVSRDEFDRWDHVVYMDEENERGLRRILGADAARACTKLLAYAGSSADVADPWYTGDFDATYRDVVTGCSALFQHVTNCPAPALPAARTR